MESADPPNLSRLLCLGGRRRADKQDAMAEMIRGHARQIPG
jgi:hypothetical protein